MRAKATIRKMHKAPIARKIAHIVLKMRSMERRLDTIVTDVEEAERDQRMSAREAAELREQVKALREASAAIQAAAPEDLFPNGVPTEEPAIAQAQMAACTDAGCYDEHCHAYLCPSCEARLP